MKAVTKILFVLSVISFSSLSACKKKFLQESDARDNAAAFSIRTASVKLRINDAKGRDYLSGTVFAHLNGEYYVLTAGHGFRESQGKGKIEIFLDDSSMDEKDALVGELIHYSEPKPDLAVVKFRAPGKSVAVAKLASADAQNQIQPKSTRVITAGYPFGKEYQEHSATILRKDQYVGPSNYTISYEPQVGRSGGGLFLEGSQELIGVCNAADAQAHTGLFAALPSIHEFLQTYAPEALQASGQAAEKGPSDSSSQGSDSEESNDDTKVFIFTSQEHGICGKCTKYPMDAFWKILQDSDVLVQEREWQTRKELYKQYDIKLFGTMVVVKGDKVVKTVEPNDDLQVYRDLLKGL